MRTRTFSMVVLVAAVAGVAPAAASAGNVLAVQTARSGKLTAAGAPGHYALVLRGVRPRVTTFDDSPGRRAGSLPAARLLELLFPGRTGGPHNASITAAGRTMAVRLRAGKYHAATATMTYKVIRLEGSTTLPSTLKRPSLFIDDIGDASDLGGDIECAGWLQNNTPYALGLENQWVYMWMASEFTNNPGGTVGAGGYTNWYETDGGVCQSAVEYGSDAFDVTISVQRFGDSPTTQYSCSFNSSVTTDPPTTCNYDDAATQATGMITYVLSGGPVSR
jgi:hypothetical protein